MYAIRSYYGITEARFVLDVNQVKRSRELLWVDDTQARIPDSGQEREEDAVWLSRITSYNVCYTKLLRMMELG